MASLLKRQTDGHNLIQGPVLHPVGIVYVTFIVAYTTILLVVLGYVWLNYRRRAAVRIRGLLINTLTILTIHIYVAALFIVYPLNSWFKCGTEFWSMNTVFPLGIALFQASNVRLMSYAKTQSTMLELRYFSEKRQPLAFSFSGFRKWFGDLDLVRKTSIYIAVGLIIQLLLTLFLFFGSRRFSPDIGFFGTHVGPAACRQGFEWIPSVIWQFLWAWFYGPWILYRTRKIRDTHYWALQTRIAVVAGLPGTPMWLGFLYSHSSKIEKVNAWWPPAMWFAPGLIVMQVSSLVFGGIDILAETRRKNEVRSGAASSISTNSVSESVGSSRKSKELANSYQAFEYHLRHSLRPLFEFSVKRDFTSENVLFLVRVRNFKTKWRRNIVMAPVMGTSLGSNDEIEMFEDAARIYFELVRRQSAKIPINVDSRIYEDLEQTFRTCKYECPPKIITKKSGRSGSRKRVLAKKLSWTAAREAIAPWESPTISATRPATPVIGNWRSTSPQDSTNSETDIIEIGLHDRGEHPLLTLPPSVHDRSRSNDNAPIVQVDGPDSSDPRTPRETTIESPAISYGKITPNHAALTNRTGHSTTHGYVPTRFNLHVFDRAEQSIKYLVYTNTWKSYVKTMSNATLSSLSGRPDLLSQGLVPRRDGQDGMSRMTDVEMHDLDVELQERLHHGVLDSELGPVPVEHVDARCAACRWRMDRRAKELIESASLPSGYGAACLQSFGPGLPVSSLDGSIDHVCLGLGHITAVNCDNEE